MQASTSSRRLTRRVRGGTELGLAPAGSTRALLIIVLACLIEGALILGLVIATLGLGAGDTTRVGPGRLPPPLIATPVPAAPQPSRFPGLP